MEMVVPQKKKNRKHPPETDMIICFGWRVQARTYDLAETAWKLIELKRIPAAVECRHF